MTVEKKKESPELKLEVVESAIPSLRSILTEICQADPEKRPQNAVILISAEYPGSGSTTVANGIAEYLAAEYEQPEMRFVGGKVRQQIQSSDDTNLTENLHKVPDPLDFDRPFYRDLPEGKPLIIEGKLAVDAGPNFLKEIGADNNRPIIGIRLQSHPLLSAIRIMRREGVSLPDIIKNPLDIPPRAAALTERTKHIAGLIERTLSSFDNPVSADKVIELDTTQLNQEEIIGYLADQVDWISKAPEWEEEQLKEAVAHLESISRTRGLAPNLKDSAHFRENIEAVTYNLTERLYTTLNEPGLKDIRGNIRNMLTHATFALLLKKMPRFLRHRLTNAIELDTASQKWTPEYYKMMVGWQTIKGWLKGQSVLDPFAGAGTFVNVLTARGIVKNATFGDISYIGGVPLNGEADTYYDPNLNTAMMQAVFNGLPSWYKPQCLSRLGGYVTLDAKKLPFASGSFDWTTGDPPYGINLNEGGIDLFFECLPEMLRVSREGGFFLVPLQWVDKIKSKGISFQQLTDDLASHNSDVPTCFISVPKSK